MKFQFEFTFEQAVLILKLVDSTPLPHKDSRPIVDYMVAAISEQQDAMVAKMQAQDKESQNEQLPANS
jgi:hypothetical protein